MEKYKLTIALNNEQKELLEGLIRKNEATRKRVILKALGLLKVIQEAYGDRSPNKFSICVKEENNIIKEFWFPLLD